ncbi:MAG: outer membrane protein assembly factor BamE [Phycisphaerales bacterium]
MRTLFGALVLGGVCLVGTGCTTTQYTTGAEIKEDSVKQIVKGKTTMQEVIALFGEPQRATPMGDETIYTYEYRVTKGTTVMVPYVASTDSKDEADKLSIVFDRSGVVKTFNVTRGIGKRT